MSAGAQPWLGDPVESWHKDPIEGPNQLGEFGSHFVGQVAGAGHALLHPIDTLSGMLDDAKAELGAASERFANGDPATAARHLGNAVPVIGPLIRAMSEEASTQTDTGEEKASHYGAALGDLAGFLTVGKIAKAAPRIVSGAPGVVTRIAENISKPGTRNMATGAAEVGGGAFSAMEGHPFLGAGIAARGLRNIKTGLAERAAAEPKYFPDAEVGTTPAAESEVEAAMTRSSQPSAGPVLVKPWDFPSQGKLTESEAAAIKGEHEPVHIDLSQPEETTESSSALAGETSQAALLDEIAGGKGKYAKLTAGEKVGVDKIVAAIQKEDAATAARPVNGSTKPTISESPKSVPTSDPNVVWDPSRGHIDTRTGKAPVKEPDVVILPADEAQSIVDKLGNPERFYGKTSLKPNSPGQIERNAQALKKTKPPTLGDMMENK